MKTLERCDYSGFWKKTHDWVVPYRPKFALRCPICGSEARYKEYYPHVRHFKNIEPQYRIDLWFKCCRCAYVWQHGISTDEDYYREITEKMKEKIGVIRPLHILEVIDNEIWQNT